MVAGMSSGQFNDGTKSFCFGLCLHYKVISVFWRVAAIQHFAENSVRILGAFVGSFSF